MHSRDVRTGPGQGGNGSGAGREWGCPRRNSLLAHPPAVLSIVAFARETENRLTAYDDEIRGLSRFSDRPLCCDGLDLPSKKFGTLPITRLPIYFPKRSTGRVSCRLTVETDDGALTEKPFFFLFCAPLPHLPANPPQSPPLNHHGPEGCRQARCGQEGEGRYVLRPAPRPAPPPTRPL